MEAAAAWMGDLAEEVLKDGTGRMSTGATWPSFLTSWVAQGLDRNHAAEDQRLPEVQQVVKEDADGKL